MMNNETPDVTNESEAKNLCKLGCGFYGSVQFKDMCSKCYQEQEQIKHEATSSTASTPVATGSGQVSLNKKRHRRHSDDATITGVREPYGNTTASTSSFPPMRTGSDALASNSVRSSFPTASSSRSLKRKYNDDELTSTGDDSRNAETTETNSSSRVSRCSWCRKRVGLTAISCRCGGLYCPLHRYSNQHECSFDYKAQGKLELTKSNPQIRCAKIRKI